MINILYSFYFFSFRFKKAEKEILFCFVFSLQPSHGRQFCILIFGLKVIDHPMANAEIRQAVCLA